MASFRQTVAARLRLLQGPLGSPTVQVVWVLALGIFVYLLVGRAASFEYVGIARALQYEVSPSMGGNVHTVLVDLYDPVERGQVVARLDDVDVKARLETERAVISQLSAELGAESARVGLEEANLATDRRRFHVDEQRLHLDTLSLKVVLESDRIELERLNLQHQRSVALGAEGVLAQSDVDNLRLLRDTVARRIEENTKLLKEAEQQYGVAIGRRESYEGRFSLETDPLLEPLRAAVHAQERRIEELDLQRRSLALHSPVTGRVSQVLARVGQYVLPGEALLFVEEDSPSEVVVYAPESAASRIAQGSRVRASRRGAPAVVAESLVTRTSATIQATPQRLWRDPQLPEYGLAFVISAAPQLGLKPGELVTVAMSGK